MSFKRFLLLITCLSIFIASFGQWSLVLENENFWLAGTYFLNADTGFAAGEDIEEYRGIILKTSDGGATWDTAYLGDYGLVVPRVFDFIGPDTGYAAGQDGWLWRTFDGGENWELYTHAWTPIDIYNVCFLNSQVGFVDYAYTTDGGYNWTGLGFGFHTEFEKIGEEALLAAGDDGIFRTHNLGETWDTVLYIEGISFESISMTDDLTGYCTDNLSNLYKTMDGGGTWSLVNAATFFELDRIRFISEGLGYASFNQTDVPRIIRTEDEGVTWTPELICTDQIWGYQFIGSETAYAVTADGKIYKTTNAGGATPPPRPMDANWVTTFHSNSWGRIFDSDNNVNGDVFFTAEVWDTLFAGDTFFAPPDSLSDYNLILGKVNKEGNPEWVKYIWSKPLSSFPSNIPVRVNPASGEIVTVFVDIGLSKRIMAFNHQGELTWEEAFSETEPPSNYNEFYIHDNGEIFITGKFWQTISYQDIVLVSQGYGLYILRLQADGTVIDFSKAADGNAYPTGIIIDQDLDVILSANINGALVINEDTIHPEGTSLSGDIIKLDSNLSFQWNYNLEQAGTSAQILELNIGSDNSIFYAGYTNPWGGPSFASRLSTDGELLFLDTFGKGSTMISLDITMENHMLITGDFAGTLKIDEDSIVSYGDNDQYLIDYSAEGDLEALYHTWNIKDSYVGTPYPGKVNAFGSSFFINGTYKPEIHFLDQVLPGDYETNFFIANCGEMPEGYEAPPEPLTFRVIPNPSHGIFMIDSQMNKGISGRIRIHTMAGDEISTFLWDNEMTMLDLSNEPSGVYIMTIQTEKGQQSCKIVIH